MHLTVLVRFLLAKSGSRREEGFSIAHDNIWYPCKLVDSNCFKLFQAMAARRAASRRVRAPFAALAALWLVAADPCMILELWYMLLCAIVFYCAVCWLVKVNCWRQIHQTDVGNVWQYKDDEQPKVPGKSLHILSIWGDFLGPAELRWTRDLTSQVFGQGFSQHAIGSTASWARDWACAFVT